MAHSERSALTVAGWCTREIVGGTSSINDLHLAVAELGMGCGLQHSEGDYQMVALNRIGKVANVSKVDEFGRAFVVVANVD